MEVRDGHRPHSLICPDNRSPLIQPGAKAPGPPMNGTMAASSHRVTLGPLVAAIDQGTSSTRFLVSLPGAALLCFGVS